jgi:hypothetical protein
MKSKIYQSYNNKIDAWVKMRDTGRGVKIIDVKKTNPTQKFKNIPVKK